MKKKGVSTFIIFFFLSFSSYLFLVPGNLHAQQSFPTMEYAYPDQSVWTTKTDPNGKLENPLLLMAEEIFSKLKIDFHAKPYPAKRLFERLQTGQSSFSMLVRVPSLQQTCVYSEKPITFIELRVYHRSNAAPIASKEDFQGKKVILIQGYSYGGIGKYLRDNKNVTIFEAAKHSHAFEMLKYGRAGYLLDYTGPSQEILQAVPIEGITHDIVSQLDVFLLISKHYPNAKDIMQKIESIANTIDITQYGLPSPNISP